MGFSASRKYPEWETQTYTYIEMAKYQKDTDQVNMYVYMCRDMNELSIVQILVLFLV